MMRVVGNMVLRVAQGLLWLLLQVALVFLVPVTRILAMATGILAALAAIGVWNTWSVVGPVNGLMVLGTMGLLVVGLRLALAGMMWLTVDARRV